MGVVILLLVLAAIAGGVWYLRRGGADKGRDAAETVRAFASRPGAAAVPSADAPRRAGRMVNPGESCCASVKKIASNWYADAEAPRLPLETCDMQQSCKCQWMRVIDRRTTHRRTKPDRRDSLRFEDKRDRRGGLDRRKGSGDFWKGAP